MVAIPNSSMKPNRYAFWAGYRKLVANIKETLSLGGEVVIPSSTRATVYTAKHVELFQANRHGAWVKHGHSWIFIGFNKIIHRRPRTKST